MTPRDEPQADLDPHSAASAHRGRRMRPTPATRLALTAALIATAAIAFGLHARASAEKHLERLTERAAIQTVDVIRPQAGAADGQISIPGDVQAFTDTPIYARTSGYLKKWYFDIGAHVKQGQVLAEIETPEVDQQLRSATADLATAGANLELAQTTAERNENLLKSRSVSTQERDNAVGAYNADRAIFASRQADVARLQQLHSYEKVYAPFDGIITARNTDTGALIGADSNSPLKELFHLAATDKVRVFISVPEIYASAARNGTSADLSLDEYPDRIFHGTLVRSSNAIDPASRTLLAEVDVNNTDGALLPGAYAFVHLSMPTQSGSVTIPANTLLFRREGLQVGVVRDGHVSLTPVKIGRDYGDTVQVVSGLQPTDAVIIDPSDSLIDNVPVSVRQADKIVAAQ